MAYEENRWSPDSPDLHRLGRGFRPPYVKYKKVKTKSNSKVASKSKLAQKLSKSVVEFHPEIRKLKWIIPHRLNTPSPTMNWYTRTSQNRAFQKKFLVYMPKQIDHVDLPCEIIFRRIGPKKQDFDNLVQSFKFCRDCISDFLIPGLAKGQADGDPRFTFKYESEKRAPREYGIEIEINY